MVPFVSQCAETQRMAAGFRMSTLGDGPEAPHKFILFDGIHRTTVSKKQHRHFISVSQRICQIMKFCFILVTAFFHYVRIFNYNLYNKTKFFRIFQETCLIRKEKGNRITKPPVTSWTNFRSSKKIDKLKPIFLFLNVTDNKEGLKLAFDNP